MAAAFFAFFLLFFVRTLFGSPRRTSRSLTSFFSAASPLIAPSLPAPVSTLATAVAKREKSALSRVSEARTRPLAQQPLRQFQAHDVPAQYPPHAGERAPQSASRDKSTRQRLDVSRE